MGLTFENNGNGGGFQILDQTGKSKFRTFTDGNNPWAPFDMGYLQKFDRGDFFSLADSITPTNGKLTYAGVGCAWQLCYAYKSFDIRTGSAAFKAFGSGSLVNYRMQAIVAVGSAPNTSMSFNAPTTISNFVTTTNIFNPKPVTWSVDINVPVSVPANTYFLLGIVGQPKYTITGSDLVKISLANDEPFIAVLDRSFVENASIPSSVTASVPNQLGNTAVSASKFIEVSQSILAYSIKLY